MSQDGENAPEDAEDTLPPVTLADAQGVLVAGRYRIKSELGRGGFGLVFRAADELEHRDVALKVMHAAGLGSGSDTASRAASAAGVSVAIGARAAAELLRDEFRILTQLHHPNLAAVYDFGRSEELGSVFFTQQLIEGEFIGEFLSGATREQVVDVLIQIARALDHIHVLGLLHEDLNLHNVLIEVDEKTGRGRAKIIDFGLARLLRRARGTSAAVEDDTEVLLGTPGFSAPERVRGRPTDARSDIYSLGATLYAAIVGRSPFTTKSFKEALAGQLDWRAELAGPLLETAGPVVAGLVGRMLMPDPDDRPQSARSVVLELLRREEVGLLHGDDEEDERGAYARVLVEHLPFVDRGGCLQKLIDRCHAFTSGTDADIAGVPRTLVIRAPEGMGKQRLLSELRREIQLSGGVFVGASCWSGESLPLGPLTPVVAQLASALGDRSKTIAANLDLVALARERSGEPIPESRLLEFLVACARERPYVLCLWNLAQADEAVRQLVAQIASAFMHTGGRTSLVVTTAPHAKVARLLDRLVTERTAEVWSLSPLTKDELAQMVEALFGRIPSRWEVVEMLEAFTGGHPLGVRETLRVLLEESILVRESDGWVLRSASTAAADLQQTLSQRVETRLDRVGVAAWEIASTLYLLEAPIREGRLAELTDLRRTRFVKLLERLEGEGLIVRHVEGGGATTVSLAHKSVNEAVRHRCADSIDESRVELADRIQELDDDDPSLLFLRATLLDDAAERTESVIALVTAADTLLDGGHTHLGGLLLERLIWRLRSYGGIDGLPQLLNATLTLLRRAGGSLENPRREAGHYRAGIFVAELLGEDGAQALFWLGLADRFASVQGESIDMSLERLRHAAEAAGKANDPVLSLRIANRRAEALLQGGFVDQADRYSREAMGLLENEDAEDRDRVEVIGVRIRCLSFAGRLGQARRLHETGKPIAERVPVVQRQAYLSGIAFLGILGGEPESAIPELEVAVQELREANTPRLLLSPLHNVADLHLRSSELDAAESAFEEALQVATGCGVDYHVHLNRGFLGYTRARLGRIDEGAGLLQRAINDLYPILGEHVALQQLRLLQAEVDHMRGDTARARRQLEEMVAEFLAGNELSMANMAQDALTRIEQETRTAFIEVEPAHETGGDPDGDTVRTRPIK